MRFFAKKKGFLPLFSGCAAGLSDNCMTLVILRREERDTCGAGFPVCEAAEIGRSLSGIHKKGQQDTAFTKKNQYEKFFFFPTVRISIISTSWCM